MFGLTVSLIEVLFLGVFFAAAKLVIQGHLAISPLGLNVEGSVGMKIAAGISVLACGLLRFLLSMRFELATARLSSRSLADLQKQSMQAHLDMPMSVLWSSRGGELQFHINNLPIRCKEFVLQLPVLISSASMILFVSVVLAFLSWKLFFVAFVMGVIYALFLQKVSHHVYYVVCGKLTKLEKEISEVSHEAVAGVRQIKVFHLGGIWHRFFSGIAEQHADDMAHHRWWTALPNKCLDLLIVAVFALGLIGVVILQMRPHTIDASAFLTFAFGILRIVPYLVQAGRSFGLLASTVPSVEEFYRHLDRIRQPEEAGLSLPFPAGEAPLVEIKGVSFSYLKGKRVLNGISLKLRPNTVTALVGLSGSGKSTLIDVIMGLIPAEEGTVLCNGVNIRSLKRDEWLKTIALSSQEPFLFHDTILSNLKASCPDATDDEIREAMRLAGVDEFIEMLPMGLSAMVGDRGVTLSGGQRQRLALARALLKKSGILILDEPTGALDARNEEAIYRRFWPALKKRTTLIVSHNLSSIRDADHICVLVDGVIHQRGNHDELMSTEGIYRDLCLVQSGRLRSERPESVES